MDELKDKLCYLASPYEGHASGDLTAAFRDACRLAAKLRNNDLYVYSPIAEGHAIAMAAGIDPRDRSFFLHNNRMMLGRSDILIVAKLPGWRTSEGVIIERCAFEIMHKPIYELDPETLALVHVRYAKPPRDRIDGWSEEEIKSDRDGYLTEAAT